KTVEKKEQLTLLDENLFVEWGFLNQESEKNSAYGKWKKVSGNSKELVFQQRAKSVIYEMKLNLENDYMLTVEQHILNVGRSVEKVYAYGRFVQKGEVKSGAYVHKGWIGYLNGEFEEETTSDVIGEDAVDFAQTTGWFGWTNQYTQAVLKTDLVTQTVRFSGTEKQSQADYQSEVIVLQAGESKRITSHIYLGPKDETLLKKYEEKGFSKLSQSVDYGWFYFFSKPLAQALHWLGGWLGNMGWAIILLTFIIRMILYPLSRKSLHAMAKMKELQPKIKAMQAKYKDDKRRLQQEMMKLYKMNKVSPASGCIPMLLQIPVFFALYRVLMVSIDLRHAEFFYLPDLSLADPTSIFNFFGALPYGIPSWMPAVGLLPIIMGISMWVQQKIQGSTSTTPQNKIMMYLPFIFVFMFGGLPSGLVLYWMVSNLFSLAQTVIIKRSL
ncbi:MAG: membrane protein insertase YidC, partial [Alphaproteobacteria bacterium]